MYILDGLIDAYPEESVWGGKDCFVGSHISLTIGWRHKKPILEAQTRLLHRTHSRCVLSTPTEHIATWAGQFWLGRLSVNLSFTATGIRANSELSG